MTEKNGVDGRSVSVHLVERRYEGNVANIIRRDVVSSGHEVGVGGRTGMSCSSCAWWLENR